MCMVFDSTYIVGSVSSCGCFGVPMILSTLVAGEMGQLSLSETWNKTHASSTVLSIWYIFSIKTKTKEEMEN